MRSICSAKAPRNISAKNCTADDFVSTVRLYETSTNDFVKDGRPHLFHGFRNKYFNKISLDNMLYTHS